MYQKVYIDIVFAANLIMDYVLLRLVGRTMRCKCRRTRCAAAAVMGAFFSCVLLFIPAVRYRDVLILFHCICAMGMIRISYGIKKGALLLKTLLMLYLTAFLWGGFLGSFSEEQKDDGSVVSADSVEYLWDPWDSPSGGRPYTDLPEKYLSCNHLFCRKEVCILWIL